MREMIAYKCRFCGSGELEPLGDGRKAMCTYCDTVTVLPTLDSEAYNQANELREKCDFDQAVMAFERIVMENPTDSESYWNLLLSRYGVEYVKEKDGSYVPTIHRMTYASIMDDPDYQKALKYADGFSHRMYQEDAAKIDRILKRAAQIAQSQPAYDIFISYKETDANKARTEDSGIAQNIYDALKEKHPDLKIFLSRITLKETAAGLEYEPIIFSALNSAKMMIVVGTSKENIESTWVKNEWSRYRKMMDKDKNKYMTVVYKKGMEPSKDFPKELRMFSIQATEASGFYLQDFVAGVENLLGIKEQPTIDSARVYQTSSSRQVENLLVRAQQALEMGNKEEAIGFLEKALGLDAQCARAWWGLFEIETDKLTYINELIPFELGGKAASNWKMVERYAQGAEREQFMDAYHEYEARWNAAYQEREDGIIRAANKEKVTEAIAEIKEKTEDGLRFEGHNRYMPGSNYMNSILAIAVGEDKEWLEDFCKRYERNYQKFRELQELKGTNPVKIIESTDKYKELRGQYDKARSAVEKAEKALNGITMSFVVVGLIITALVWFFGTDIGIANSWSIVTIHIIPIIGCLFAFTILISALGLWDGELVSAFIVAVVLSIIGYFVFQYVGVVGARKVNPEIPTSTIFSGIFWLLALAIVVVFIILIFVNFIGALIFLGAAFFITGKIPALQHIYTYEPAELVAAKDSIFGLLLIVMLAATALTIFRYIKNKGALVIYRSANAKFAPIEKAYNDYYNGELEKYTAPFKNFVSSVYLKDMSKKDL